jgi:menaquinone-9 beta-reductase
MNDFTIIGGGPAGASAAIHLAQNGASVRLYEKKRFPRPKLCGGFLSPEALPLFDELGVREAMRSVSWPIRKVRVSTSGGQIAEAALPSEGWSVDRFQMDLILLEQAKAAGIEVKNESFIGTHDSSARWTVVAGGRMPAAGPRYWGIQAFFGLVAGVDDAVELHLFPGGYAGINRMTKEVVNFCSLIDPEKFKLDTNLDVTLLSLLKRHSPLARRLSYATRITPWQSTGPVVMGRRTLAAGRTLFVGDAACVVDPFFGEGMAMALHGSKLLAEAWRQAPDDVNAHYERRWRERLGGALPLGSVLRRALGYRYSQEVFVGGLRAFPAALPWLTQKSRIPYEHNQSASNRQPV